MLRSTAKLGPRDHGRRMTLPEFTRAECPPGLRCELSRGVVLVLDTPDGRHTAAVEAVRARLARYAGEHPAAVHTIAAGGESRLVLTELGSERRPDVALYRTPPPDEDRWLTWVPELVVEVLAPGSGHQDCRQRRDEYLAFGVRECWLLDPEAGELLALRRHGGTWVERRVRPPEIYETPLLPGLRFDCGEVFRAAEAAGRG